MNVMKFGGGCLKDAAHFHLVTEIVKRQPRLPIPVVSAVYGVTDRLVASIATALESERGIARVLTELQEIHGHLITRVIQNDLIRKKTAKAVTLRLQRLEKLLHAVACTGEVSGSLHATIVSYGERLTAWLLTGALEDAGIRAAVIETDRAGLITDDCGDNATMIPEAARGMFRETLLQLLKSGICPVVTGFFGRSADGRITTFGRNGTDYSAAAVAFAVDADVLEIWKDVDGFMTADPKIVAAAHSIDHLSYYEAAELSYFGAKILHPRTVEPLRGRGIPIHIKNLYEPENPGTCIQPAGYQSDDVIKSVTCNRKIVLLRVMGSGVGIKPGIIADIGRTISAAGVNIYSVITSQTCINLLLDRADAARSRAALHKLCGGVIEQVELREDIALVSVVGQGVLQRKGIAARVFGAVAAAEINVEMFSAGASDVAYYFIVRQVDVEKAVRVIHREFFENME